MPNYFATCARGLEPVLADELHAPCGPRTSAGPRRRCFRRRHGPALPGNLWLRTAVRVLRPVLEVACRIAGRTLRRRADDRLVGVHDARPHPGRRLQRPRLARSRTRSTPPGGSRTPSATSSSTAVGRRPSVDVEAADGRAQPAHLPRTTRCSASTGPWDSLHKRGYRPILTKAPLNEALAAGLMLQHRLGRRRRRWSIRCAGRARCRSRRRGSPCAGRRG